MKKLYSFLMGIVAIILVLWGVSYHIESRTKVALVTNWSSTIGETILIQSY